MPFFLENYGLDGLCDSEDATRALIHHIMQNGKPIVGYYENSYLNMHYGDVQMILRTERNDDGTGLCVTGIDAHVAGESVWEARISDMNINRKDSDCLSRRILISQIDDDSGLAVVNLINADVLPNFAKDEPIIMQMAAFPAKIDYFSDEDEYINAQPNSTLFEMKSLILEDGLVIPTGLLSNRSPSNPDFDEDDNLDDYVNVRGTVKKLVQGVFELNGEKYHSFIRCIIGTQYGDLELLHTIDDVAEGQHKNIHVGAIVSAVCVLSGDVAIYEYENGVIYDEAHDLSMLRGIFSGENPERMRNALAANVEYLSEHSGITYNGADEIIERFREVQDNTKNNCPYSAFYATISRVDSSASIEQKRRAIALSRDNGQSFDSVAFIDVGNDGKIIKLTISDSEYYRIVVDTSLQPRRVISRDEYPGSAAELMIKRARMQGIVSDNLTDDEVINGGDHTWQFKDSSKKMFDALCNAELSDEMLENAFGYLFAKAIETERCNQQAISMFLNYEPSDAFAGTFRTSLNAIEEEKIVGAMEIGKSFAMDFKYFQEEIEQFNIEKNLPMAFFIVQQLGRIYCAELFA